MPQLSFASAGVTVSEAQGEATIELRLSEAYYKPVSLNYSTGGGSATANSDYKPATGSLIFNPGEVTKSFVVSVLADGLNEPSETVNVTLSGISNATLGEPQLATVTITDADAPPTLRFSGSSRTVAESVGSLGITIELSEPSALDVSVPFVLRGTAALNDHGLRAGTAIIPAGATSARIRFNVVDDLVDEEDETLSLYLGTTTNAQLGPPSVYMVSITDNDTAGVDVTPRTLGLREGDSGSYSVVLQSEPVAPVRVALRADKQLAAQPAELLFTPANWNIPQTATITAVDDAIDEPDSHQGTLSHTLASADPFYDDATRRFAVSDVAVNVTDNDTAGVQVSATELALSEATSATTHQRAYTVRLTSEPVSPVTIALTPDSQASVSPSILIFTAANWNQPRQVTVTADDDSVDEEDPHGGAVAYRLASDDPNYNQFAVAALKLTIGDNDTAGLVVSATELTVSEEIAAPNHSVSYTLRLTSEPLAAVRITPSEILGALPLIGENPQVTVTPSGTVAFNPANWNVPQTITVTAKDDAFDETDPHTTAIRHALLSVDPLYNGGTLRFVIADLPVAIEDNDTAGVSVTPLAHTITEGESFSYSVQLTSRPLDAVTITIIATDAISTVVPSELTFEPENWHDSQPVTVTTKENFVDAPNPDATIRHAATSIDPGYQAIPIEPVTVTILDDDTAGVSVSTAALRVSEALAAPDHTQSYELRLTSEPTATVIITPVVDLAQLMATTPISVSFDASNWSMTQTVTLEAIDDPSLEANPHTASVTHLVASADPNYAGQSVGSIAVEIADNDEAGIDVTPARIQLSESLAGSFPNSTAIDVSLRSKPTAPVTVTLIPDEQFTTSATTLIFTPETYTQPQQLTLTATDDFLDETELHTGTLALSAASDDVNYSRTFPGYELDIEDDDTAGIAVSPPSGLITSENGGTITFTVRLTSQPRGLVQLTVASENTSEGVVGGPAMPLVFGPSEMTDASQRAWNDPVTITVTGVDDSSSPTSDGLIAYTVTAMVTGSEDSAYFGNLASVSPVSVALSNSDNEPALITVSDAATLNEGNGGLRTMRFPVTLSRPITAPVTISYETYDLSATGGDDFQLPTGTLTIPAGATDGNIVVRVIGDVVYEADEQFGVRLTGATVAGDLVALHDPEAVGTIRNDEAASLHFAAADTLALENSGAAQVVVVLDAPFANPVSVSYNTITSGSLAGTATAGEDYVGVSGILSFAAGEMSKTITLPILDNDALPDERLETVRLSLFAASGAPISSPGVASVTLVEDNEPSAFSAPQFLSTTGPASPLAEGNWYTSGAGAGGSNYIEFAVPCTWSAGQPLGIELWSPAVHYGAGSVDAALDADIVSAPDSSAFELYGPGVAVSADAQSPGPGGLTSLYAQTYSPSTADEAWETFFTLADPQPCGRYVLRSATDGDDENHWAIRSSGGREVSFGALLSAVEQESPAGVQLCTAAWMHVAAGTPQLTIRTFDLGDGDPLSALRLYRPGEPFDPHGQLGGISATLSASGSWASNSIAWPKSGWWRAVVCTSGRNHYSLETSAGDVLLPVSFDPPAELLGP